VIEADGGESRITRSDGTMSADSRALIALLRFE
jgi:hypothetical protein